jgi:hypothetical protein
MKRFLTAFAAIAMLAVSAVSPAKAGDPGTWMGTYSGIPAAGWAAAAGVPALFGYMIYATETGKNIGVSKAQADEKALADAVMNRYQTVPAYHSVAINGVPTTAFAAAK